MDIAISKGTFTRKVGDDVFFYNPQSGASIVINDGSVLYNLITKQLKPLNCVFEDIAKYYNVTVEVVKSDFSNIINEMICEGMIDTSEVNHKKEGAKFASCVKRNKPDDIKEDPISKFYRERHLPRALHIDVTSNCNERCIHCYLSNHKPEYLSFRNIEKVLTEFRELQGLTVYISGGECMTHPDFYRILLKCKKLDLNIVILSNLTLCDSTMIKLLKEINPQYINVSLYSMSSAEHDKITTVPGSWEKTMNAILKCENAGIAIRIATPLLKINRHAFPALKEFADKHNMHMVPDFGIIAKNDHDKSNLQHTCSALELKDTLLENKTLFDMEWSKVCRDDPDATLCDIGVFRIHINSTGDFYPCPSMHGYVIGNINHDSLKDVWNGERLQYLRNIRLKDLKQCVNCAHRNFCEPCLAYNFNATGDIFKTIPNRCETATIVHCVYGTSSERRKVKC